MGTKREHADENSCNFSLPYNTVVKVLHSTSYLSNTSKVSFKFAYELETVAK